MNNTKVKKLDERATFDKAYATDVGYDLTCVGQEIKGGMWRLKLGVVVVPPLGYYYQIIPRSSFPKSGWFMANSVGIVDPEYRGEWLMNVAPWKDYPDLITSFNGKRVAQAVLCKEEDVQPYYSKYRGLVLQSRTKINFVKELNGEEETERGTGGFGSTGS